MVATIAEHGNVALEVKDRPDVKRNGRCSGPQSPWPTDDTKKSEKQKPVNSRWIEVFFVGVKSWNRITITIFGHNFAFFGVIELQ